MYTCFLSSSDVRWNEALLSLRHDVYDLPEYVAICGRYEEAKAVAFYAKEGEQIALIPLLQRPIPASFGALSSWSDATSPYGYGSALFTGGPEWSSRAANAFARACAERQIISVFVRLHPLLPSPRGLDSVGTRVPHGQTVYVNLELPSQVLRGQLRNNHRRDICRLQAQGFTVSEDDWTQYDQFIEIYGEAMRRLDAAPYYLFPHDYFTNLRQALGSRLHLFSVLAPNRSIACAGLLMETEGVVGYHLGATAQEYRHLAPTKLMLEYVIHWAKAAGNKMLHLGGGVGAGDDALFRFKTGFSDLRSTFQTWRVICDQKRYVELTEFVGEYNTPIDGFFPAYRGIYTNSQRQ